MRHMAGMHSTCGQRQVFDVAGNAAAVEGLRTPGAVARVGSQGSMPTQIAVEPNEDLGDAATADGEDREATVRAGDDVRTEPEPRG